MASSCSVGLKEGVCLLALTTSRISDQAAFVAVLFPVMGGDIEIATPRRHGLLLIVLDSLGNRRVLRPV